MCNDWQPKKYLVDAIAIAIAITIAFAIAIGTYIVINIVISISTNIAFVIVIATAIAIWSIWEHPYFHTEPQSKSHLLVFSDIAKLSPSLQV